MNRVLLDELGAIGCRVDIISSSLPWGLRYQPRNAAEFTPPLARQVADIFIRHGFREVAEGVWMPARATEEQVRAGIQEMREDELYKRHRAMVDALDAEHPDWSDEQIADELFINPRDVADLRP